MVRIYDIPDNTFETDEEDETSDEDTEDESDADGKLHGFATFSMSLWAIC